MTARVDNGSEEKVKQLNAQLLGIQNHLLQVELERNKMESQLGSAREEVSSVVHVQDSLSSSVAIKSHQHTLTPTLFSRFQARKYHSRSIIEGI